MIPHTSAFRCGDRVLIDGDIEGVIEEIVFARGMMWPVYLVEWWHEGQREARRFHQVELVPKEARP